MEAELERLVARLPSQTVSSSSIVELLASAGPSNTASRSAGVTSAHVALSGGVVLSPGAVVLVAGREERAGSERSSSPSSLHAVAASTPTSSEQATPVRRMHPIWERRYRLPMTATERPKLNWRKSETHGLEADPEPRAIDYTIISVDDHLVEPPDMFEGRLPAKLAGAGAAGRRDRRGPRGLGVRRADLLPGRPERGRRPQARGLEGRAHPLRRDAARLLRHRRPHHGHGHQRRLGVGELPVADHRLLRPGVLAVLRPRARPRGDAGVERLVPRGVVLALPGAHRSRWASRTSATPSRARPRSAATPSAGFTRGHAARAAAPHRHAVDLSPGWWDPIIEACAETDTVICLHVGSSGVVDLPAGRAGGRRSAPRCSASSRWRRAPSGCGRATPCSTPT